MKRMTFLKGLVGAAAIAAIGLPVVAQETIKIGEINHYKRSRRCAWQTYGIYLSR